MLNYKYIDPYKMKVDFNLKNYSYIWQGDTNYLILYKNKPLCYIDLDNYNIDMDKITNKRKEKYYLNKVISYLIDDLALNFVYYDYMIDLRLRGEEDE